MNATLWKRILILTLCAVLTVGLVPDETYAMDSSDNNSGTFNNNSGMCGANLRWTETGSAWFATLTISGTGPMYDFEWHDPGDYVGIGGFAPPWTYNLQTVIIENGATSIGTYAFAHQVHLESITIPASVTSIGRAAFESCNGLKDIYYGGSAEDWARINIGHMNINMSNVTIHYNCDVPGNPSEEPVHNPCGENAFWEFDETTGWLRIFGSGDMENYDSNMEVPWHNLSLNRILGIRIEAGITGVGDHAFFNCKELTAVEMADSVTRIGNYVFRGCDKLTSIRIPDSVTRMGYNVFSECYLLENANIPAGLTIIPGELFRSCALTSIEIPEGVTEIHEKAFNNCNLVTLSIPKSVRYIGKQAFYANPLTDIYYAGTESEWEEIAIEEGNYAFDNATIHFSPSIPEEEPEENPAGQCGENVFWEFDVATGVLTLSGAGDMYDFAYDAEPWCPVKDDVTSVRVREGITKIGEWAFSSFSAMTEIDLPDGLTSIGYSAFSNCTKLTNIQIPQSVTNLAHFSFAHCSSLSEINIPDGITRIDNNTFWNCSNLSIVHIPDSITAIGVCAFSNCEKLRDVTIPNSVTSIEDLAFGYCASFTNVVLPEGLTAIGRQAFTHCTNLTSVYIPQSMWIIDMYAFAGCTNLTDVYFGGTEEEWGNLWIEIGNGVLENATIHFNSPRPEDEPEELPEIPGENTFRGVRFFVDWEESEQRVYFGVDSDVSCAVTEETDTTGLENLPIHCYVFVETKMVDGQEILLSIRKVTSGMGTVESVGESQIVISGKNYGISGDTEIPDNCLNRQVLFHYEDNTLLGLEILQERTGYLTYWSSTGSTMNIRSREDSDDDAIFWLSDLATADSKIFMSRFVQDSVSTSISVNYLVDCERQIYEILPNVDYRPGGFSAKEDGWPIGNIHASFGYPDNYVIPEWVYYTHGIDVVSVAKENYEHLRNAFGLYWNGNCFGLALLAVAHYNGQVDLKPYFTGEGDSLNEFGYDILDRNESGAWYALYHHQNNNIVRHPIVTRIEQAQCSQMSWEILTATDWFAWDYQKVIEHLNEPNPVPLIINLNGHSVVTDTSIKPIDLGNNRYIIPLYDCNAPYAPETAEGLKWWYDKAPSALLIDLNTDEWEYWYGGKMDKGGDSNPNILDVTNLSDSFFDGNYSYEAEELIIFVDLIREKDAAVFEIIYIDPTTGNAYPIIQMLDGAMTVLSGNANIRTYSETMSGSVKGIISLPLGEYIVNTDGNIHLTCLYDNNVTVFGADKGFEATLDCSTDTVTVRGTEDGTEIACLQASSDVDVASMVSGVVNPGDCVSLMADLDDRAILVGTTVDPDDLEVIHVVDGDETEITPDMIHQHIPAEPVRENEQEDGSYDLVIYCESCGEELSRQQVEGEVPAHIPGDITGDGEVNNKDLTRLFRYLSGFEVEVNEAALDITGDDAVNNKDLTRLFRYLSGYDVEIF